MVSFIDEHRGEHGVEPICKQLPIAPSTCYAHKSLEREPDWACDRSKRGQWLEEEIERVWDENLQVYGVRKVWRQVGTGKYRSGSLHRGTPDETAWHRGCQAESKLAMHFIQIIGARAR